MLLAKDLLYRANHSEAKVAICFHELTEHFDQIRDKGTSLEQIITIGGEVDGWEN